MQFTYNLHKFQPDYMKITEDKDENMNKCQNYYEKSKALIDAEMKFNK